MQKSIRYVGLDVHAETIAVAVAETGGEVRSMGTIPNSPDAVRKLVKKLAQNASHLPRRAFWCLLSTRLSKSRRLRGAARVRRYLSTM